MCCLYLYSFDGDSGLSNLTDSKWEEQSHWESDSVEHGSHQESFLSSEDISSEPIHNEGAQLDKSRGWEEEAKIESSVVGSPSNNSNLLSENILIVKCFLVMNELTLWNHGQGEQMVSPSSTSWWPSYHWQFHSSVWFSCLFSQQSPPSVFQTAFPPMLQNLLLW